MTGEPAPDIAKPAAAARPPSSKKRSAAIDFFRGLGLLMVYVDHIVPNFWRAFTLQGIGLSDFAEIFVFLSGYVNAAIYARVLDSGPARTVVAVLLGKTASRMLKLYAAHLATMAACFGLVTLFAARRVFIDQAPTNLFLSNPAKYMLRAVVLAYAPFAHSILPLYIVFVPFLPLIVIGLRRFPAFTLVVSLAIWLAARYPGFIPPQTQSGEAWIFDPLAWQFMLVLGSAAQVYRNSPVIGRLFRRPIIVAAVACIAVILALKMIALSNPLFLMDHHFGRLAEILRENYGKSLFISYRIAYFFCLVLIAGAFLKDHHQWLESRWARIVICCGRHSLSVFCVSVVLATLASLLVTAINGGIWSQLAASLLGLAILFLLARLQEFRASARRLSGSLPAFSKTNRSSD
jgi:hypothetical protein